MCIHEMFLWTEYFFVGDTDKFFSQQYFEKKIYFTARLANHHTLIIIDTSSKEGNCIQQRVCGMCMQKTAQGKEQLKKNGSHFFFLLFF